MFESGLSSTMETMISRELGRRTNGGGHMNAMVATSETFDASGPVATMNGLRMGIMDEQRAEYENSYRSGLDVNMKMMSALRGDAPVDYGDHDSIGMGHGMTGHHFSSIDYGSTQYGSSVTPSSSMMSPDLEGHPSMFSSTMSSSQLASSSTSTFFQPASDAPSIPKIVLVPLEQEATIDERRSVEPLPMSTQTGSHKKTAEEEEDEREPLPAVQAIACANMIRPTEIPVSVREDELLKAQETTREDLLDRKLRLLSGKDLADIAEVVHHEIENAITQKDYLVAQAKLEIIGNEVSRRIDIGIMEHMDNVTSINA